MGLGRACDQWEDMSAKGNQIKAELTPVLANKVNEAFPPRFVEMYLAY